MNAPDPTSDRNLLLGILALQMDFVDRDQLVAAMHAWVLDKAQPLEQILTTQRALGEDECSLLLALVTKHMEIHDNSPQKSLAAISSVSPSVCDELRGISDDDVEASLAHVAAIHTAETDLAPTASLGSSTSQGLRFRVLRPHAKGRLELAESYLAQVEMRTGAEPPEAADVTKLDTSFNILRGLVVSGTKRSAAATLISRVLQRKGELCDRLGRPDEATKAWKTMAMLDKATPSVVAIDRAHNLAKWGQHARAIELLDGEINAPDLAADDCYNAACVLSLAAAAAAADTGLANGQRKQLSRKHADRALEFLQRARDLRYLDKSSARESLRRDPDLDAIRQRPDFQQLLTNDG